jgi:hypothetical protein
MFCREFIEFENFIQFSYLLGTLVMIFFSPKSMFFTFLNFDRMSAGENLSLIPAFLIAFNIFQKHTMKETPQTRIHKHFHRHEGTICQQLVLFYMRQTISQWNPFSCRVHTSPFFLYHNWR